MKLFKIADLSIQATLILYFIGLFIFLPSYDGGIYGYFVVGGWQLLSYLTHFFLRNNFPGHKDRHLYIRIILLLFLIGSIIALAYLPLLVLFLFGLLFISPILAFWYWIICYKELKILNRRMIVHLK